MKRQIGLKQLKKQFTVFYEKYKNAFDLEIKNIIKASYWSKIVEENKTIFGTKSSKKQSISARFSAPVDIEQAFFCFLLMEENKELLPLKYLIGEKVEGFYVAQRDIDSSEFSLFFQNRKNDNFVISTEIGKFPNIQAVILYYKENIE